MSWEAYLDSLLWGSWPFTATPEPVPNTFRSNPQPREGFVDARRDDGCIPSITVLEDISIAC
ncbi:hypothetical protein PBI_LUCKY3_51 [Microbacterium phage Lucky3]|uniref:Uncharacterized protein n=2 Tax=Kojivirus golden TaxID=2560590 RepID=A0A2P1CFX0_9CAUD|nr:hypothetical protein FDJ42_gp51 [Microbacterium phage Golden]AVJ49798.1 hypothetical protein PBI_GOLDEN_51 [Microbacterium phage Golden]AVJ50108.1 hypothetical protein PBI_LUCKY3_51 [Microbacterium phage Lucky3]